MIKNVIEVSHLTKDYGQGRGTFDISFNLRQGETLGLVGANGAGKTTAIRQIMGFIKPDSGVARINGLDCWSEAEKTKQFVGYVPGEIAFPDLKTGTIFLKCQAKLLGLSDITFANELIERLQLDPSANLKRMSKGMKQKTAVVAALMSQPDILILDEPTTGLDPLMRVRFLEIMEEEKKKGRSIIISSHLYEELEKICDRVALIDKGRIVDIIDMNTIKTRPSYDFKIEFTNKNDYKDFCKLNYRVTRKQDKYNQVTINIDKTDIQSLFRDLTMFDVKFISQVKYNLERYFNEIILSSRQQTAAKKGGKNV